MAMLFYVAANIRIMIRSIFPCVKKDLQSAKLINSIMIDCSHGNSNKDYTRQPLVVTDIAHQILEGNRSIIGIMLESNLHAGNQPAEQAVEKMKYGVSITDACINWPTTETVLKDLAEKLGPILSKRQPL